VKNTQRPAKNSIHISTVNRVGTHGEKIHSVRPEYKPVLSAVHKSTKKQANNDDSSSNNIDIATLPHMTCLPQDVEAMLLVWFLAGDNH
jgi:hypothetical protein